MPTRLNSEWTETDAHRYREIPEKEAQEMRKAIHQGIQKHHGIANIAQLRCYMRPQGARYTPQARWFSNDWTVVLKYMVEAGEILKCSAGSNTYRLPTNLNNVIGNVIGNVIDPDIIGPDIIGPNNNNFDLDYDD